MAQKRGQRWLANIRTEDGTRLRPSFPTQKAAEDWENEAKQAVIDGKPLPPVKSGKAPGREGPRTLSTLGDLFDHVRRTEWDALKSSETAIKNGSDVVDYFGRNKQVDTIGSQAIAEMAAHFASKGLAPATINRKRAALSRLLNVAKDVGVISAIPRSKGYKEAQTRFKYLDELEEKVLLAFWEAQGNRDLKDLCVLLIDTGGRCFSEVIPAHWDAFGPNFSTVTFWHTKTNQPRTVPLTKRCREILAERKKLRGNHAGPFTGVHHGGNVRASGGINESSMRQQWDEMRDFTGMKDVTPHTLRHTCCTRLILGGVDVKRVMTWMGHTAITTTMRYMQIKPTALEDVLHVLEGRKDRAA